MREKYPLGSSFNPTPRPLPLLLHLCHLGCTSSGSMIWPATASSVIAGGKQKKKYTSTIVSIHRKKKVVAKGPLQGHPSSAKHDVQSSEVPFFLHTQKVRESGVFTLYKTGLFRKMCNQGVHSVHSHTHDVQIRSALLFFAHARCPDSGVFLWTQTVCRLGACAISEVAQAAQTE